MPYEYLIGLCSLIWSETLANRNTLYFKFSGCFIAIHNRISRISYVISFKARSDARDIHLSLLIFPRLYFVAGCILGLTDCKDSKNCYQPAGHIVAGDLKIRSDSRSWSIISGWVVTWFLLGYTVRKNGGLLSTPML